MTLVAIVVGAAVVGRWVMGRRRPAPARWWWALPAAVTAQVGLGALTPQGWHGWVAGGGDALVAAWLLVQLPRLASLARAGVSLVAAGVAANLLPTVASGGMPVSSSALRRIGAAGVNVARGHLDRHTSALHAHLTWLGDSLAVPALRCVLSAGDLLMAVGVLVAAVGWPETSGTTEAAPARVAPVSGINPAGRVVGAVAGVE